MADGQITYNAGPINELLAQINSEMGQFNALNDEMTAIRKQADGVWDSQASQRFQEVYTRWTANVHEVQGVLNQIILKSRDGVENMMHTDSSVAKTM